MNIKKELLKEDFVQNVPRISAYASASKKNLKELIECFFSNEYWLTQRAARVVIQVTLQKPALIRPYLPVLVQQLHNRESQTADIRNAVRILQKIEIPEQYHAQVMNACFSFIENPGTPVAIKAFSLTILDDLSKLYPEIRRELRLLVEARFDTESAAFQSRAKYIISQK